MRKISLAGERLSSQWLIPSRPGAAEHYNPRRLLALNLTGRTRRISSSSPSPAQHLNGFQPRKRHELLRHGSIQQFNTTSKLPDSSMAPPETIETANQEFDEVVLPTWDSPEQEAEYAENFYRIIGDGQADQVMTAMTDPRSAGLVGSLPQTVFVEALHRLSPAHFVEPFRDLHHPLHAWSVLVNGLKRVEETFDEFVRNLLTVTRYRTAARHSLQLVEYTHLLDCARSMGNGPFAHQLWQSMTENGVIPDQVCYNHYMEAQVWDHCYTGAEEYHMRVLPRHYRKRRMEERNVGWKGYSTAANSVRRHVIALFRQMLDEGHLGDERAYINVMLASARVGHGPGIRHVLKTVWNIDIDALKEQPDNAKLPPATPYDPWSALYPTEKLLFAVAHALGTNNDIAGAVRTVEFISSSYNIPIPTRVWHELFERAYVLCRIRTTDHAYAKEANTIGKISMDLVRSIFDTMTSEPYNVKPTVQMYRFMINISIDQGSLKDCKFYIREAYNLLSETRAKQEKARIVVLRCLKPALDVAWKQVNAGTDHPDPSLFQSPLLAEAIQAYDIIRLQEYQQVYLLRRAVWVVARVPHWKDTPDKNWFYQERPKVMEEWHDFLPDRKRIFYDEQSGFIDMIGRRGFKDRHWVSGHNIPVRRMTDHENIFEPAEHRAWTQKGKWNDLLARYPFLDKTVAPLDRLFTFELPNSQEFNEVLEKLRGTWVEFPEDHPWSGSNNPTGGFYGRLAALGMLKPSERGIYLLDDASWI